MDREASVSEILGSLNASKSVIRLSKADTDESDRGFGSKY